MNVDITGTFGENMTAGDCAYISDGSGSLTAGAFYKADADLSYSSTSPVIAFVVTAGSTGETGTFRTDGQIELTGPLTPGSNYYVSTTAGEITATAPANVRSVGQAQSTTLLAIAANPAQSIGYDYLQLKVFA